MSTSVGTARVAFVLRVSRDLKRFRERQTKRQAYGRSAKRVRTETGTRDRVSCARFCLSLRLVLRELVHALMRQPEKTSSIARAHLQSSGSRGGDHSPGCSHPAWRATLIGTAQPFGAHRKARSNGGGPLSRNDSALCPKLCPRDRRKYDDFLSILTEANSEKPSPSAGPDRDRASAIFPYTYRLR